jgi:hypothetical protein
MNAKEQSRIARNLEVCAIQLDQLEDDIKGVIPESAIGHIRIARERLRRAAELIIEDARK